MTETPFKYRFVMLVDDNDLDNFVSQKVIEGTRFAERVYVNSSGISALEFLRNLSASGESSEKICPEVIFVDINMPIMDGFQFIAKLREINGGQFSKCKLAILTSSIYDEDRQKTKQLGDNILFLNKPMTPEMLESL